MVRNPEEGMLSSHRLLSTATHLGDGLYGKATGRKLVYLSISSMSITRFGSMFSPECLSCQLIVRNVNHNCKENLEVEMSEIFTYRVKVNPEWIDHNGHLNVAYFVLAFDYATDAYYETLLVGSDYPEESGCSVFTLGMDVDYLTELFAGDEVEITTQMLDWDYKRVHYYHTMVNLSTGKIAATNECLGMNVNLESRTSAPFSDRVQQKLSEVFEQNKSLSRPQKQGRRLAIPR